MKKLLLSSIVLFLFSFSILLFQVSCQKEVKANTNNTSSALNKIIYLKNIRTVSGLTKEIWTSNIDGTNQTKVNVSIPSGKSIDEENVNITSDGTKIILGLYDTVASSTGDIYTCNSDGTNLTKIIGNTTAGTEYTSIKYY